MTEAPVKSVVKTVVLPGGAKIHPIKTVARYSSTCDGCGGKIKKGDWIIWTPELKSKTHVGCQAVSDE